MKTFVASLTLIVGGLALAGWSLAAETAADCTTAPTCAAGTCCPQCGCHEGLVPVCHPYCTTKKTVKYKYCCKCDTICIPGHCPKCDWGCGDGGCAAGSGDGGCESGKCQCESLEVTHHMKIPYVVVTPVRKCYVTWVCPKCGCDCHCPGEAAAPAPGAPVPVAPPLPPAPGKSAAMPAAPNVSGYYSTSNQ